jgi:zinc protease
VNEQTKAAPRLPGPRFHTDAGIPVFMEPSDAIPLVDIDVVLGDGAFWDPPAKAGLTRMSAQMLRRGPRGMLAEEFDAKIEGLGASMAISVSSHSIRVHGAVIERNLEPYLELLGAMLLRPAMRAHDFARLKRRTEAELIEMRDHDRALAGRAMRSHLFGAHPYGLPINGTLDTNAKLKRGDVVARYEQLLKSSPKLIGIAGDVSAEKVRPLLERTLGGLVQPRATAKRPVPAPKLARGRRVLVVDKPQRTQTQVYLGTLGAKVGEPAFHALLVSNTAFGGTFTSRLVQEVRAERGWSYGAGSKLGADAEREAWTVWTHPAAEQVLDCIALELELVDAWVEGGLTDEELVRSQRYLVKSHAFDLETASKRLEPQLETALYGLPLDWYPAYRQLVSAVTKDEARVAVREHIASDDLSIVVVATATDELLAGLAKLPRVSVVERMSFELV